MRTKNFIGFIIISLLSAYAQAKTVKYELSVTREKINISGKKDIDFALLVNKSIPAPTLEFTEGDDAEIILKNESKEDDVSIHWHGILLDPYMDGVPYVNTPPIRPGEQFTFKFKIRQNGTYWYHSHTNVQEQKGVYGAIVIHPKERKIKYDRDIVVVLSDWTDENPSQVLKNLRKDGEYYLFKKKTMRSWWGAYQANSLGHQLYNEWTRMGGMDFSDVGYDAFLINGKRISHLPDLKQNETIRLRIINAAASSYFHVSLGDKPMNVISADGVDIKPVLANELLIGMAETYDILFKIPTNKSFELKASSQDGTGEASLWIGDGEKVPAPKKPRPDLYKKMNMGTAWETIKYTGSMTKSPMDMSSMDHSKMVMSSMDHSKMDMKSPSVIQTLTANEIESPLPTDFDSSIPRHDVKLILDGDMERYIWVINGKAIHEVRTIHIKQNEVIRFTFVNNSMMHHPMHLHGHFFRVLNKYGINSPMKHTLDVSPHSEKTIEFYSDEPGEWMLHCHNLYHLKTGMARVVKYSSFTPIPEIAKLQKEDPHLHDHLYYRGRIETATNHAQAQLNLMNTWNELELRTELRNDFGWQGEGDAFYKRWLNKYTSLIAGGTLIEREGAVVVGIGYKMPFMLETHTLIDHKGRLRLDLERRFQWTEYIYTNAEFTFRQKLPSEFEVTLMYQNQWAWSAGLMFTEHSAGVGAQYNF
jgi:FtsP/CotA-like multicopper oxidase with cupredoxin domain